jgi:hypothetical protein
MLPDCRRIANGVPSRLVSYDFAPGILLKLDGRYVSFSRVLWRVTAHERALAPVRSALTMNSMALQKFRI